MTEKSKRVDYEIKYIGWKIGATRVERHETMGDIEILELKIDDVDVLTQLEKLEAFKTALEGKYAYLEHLRAIIENILEDEK